MTNDMMFQRVDGALNMVRRGKVSAQQFALYVNVPLEQQFDHPYNATKSLPCV